MSISMSQLRALLLLPALLFPIADPPPGTWGAWGGTLHAQQLDERVRSGLAGPPATGAVLVAVHGDSLLLLEAFGHTDLEGVREMTPEHLFHLGAAGNTLLGALAVRMSWEGMVGLDAPIGTWAPALPSRLGQATLAQLLTHTAGLDDSPILGRRPDEDVQDLPPEREIELLSDRILVTEPGMIRSSSRYSAVVASHVLATAGDRPLAELLQELVLTPAGMGETVLSTADAVALGAGPGYVQSTGADHPFEPATLSPDSLVGPHLRGWTSGSDLAELLRRWLRAEAFSAPERGIADALHLSALPLVADPLDPDDGPASGFGWEVRQFGDLREVRTVGGGSGHTVVIRILPEIRLGVAVLANGSGSALHSVSSFLLEELAAGLAGDVLLDPREAASGIGGMPLPVVPPPQPVAAAGPERAGTYRNGSEMLILVEGEEGGLAADMGTARPLEIRNHGDGVLTGHLADGRQALRVRMVTDREGRVYLLLRGRAFAFEPDP